VRDIRKLDGLPVENMSNIIVLGTMTLAKAALQEGDFAEVEEEPREEEGSKPKCG